MIVGLLSIAKLFIPEILQVSQETINPFTPLKTKNQPDDFSLQRLTCRRNLMI